MIVRTLTFRFDDDEMRREFREEIINDRDCGYIGTEETWVAEIVEEALFDAEDAVMKGRHLTVERDVVG